MVKLKFCLICLASCIASTLLSGCTSEKVESSQDAPATKVDQTVNEEDWPRFLGPRSDGTSSETGFLTEWPADGLPELWSRPMGESYGAPVISRGRLLIFHRIDDEEVVESIDAETGEIDHWTYSYPTEYVDNYGYNGGPRSSPTVDGDFVYTFGAEGVLTCLSFDSGALVWQRQVNDDFKVPQGFFGVGVAPVIEENLILINVGGPNGAGVVAFNKSDGETVWTASTDQASYSTPVVATIRGERLAIFHTADGLLVLEAATGAIRYSYPFRSELRESAIAATPVVIGDIVFLSATYKIGAVALQLAPEGLKVIWRDQEAMQNHWAISVYKDGYLYGLDGRYESGANFRCIDFETGELIWTTRARIGRAAFVMADGHLIAVGERGHLVLIEVSSERYIEKARAHVLDYPAWTPPVLSHGRLYVRSESTLKCLDLRKH